MTTTRTRRLGPGSYEVTAEGVTYYVFQTLSAYGDLQWVVDTTTEAGWGQFDTLREAKRAIAAHA